MSTLAIITPPIAEPVSLATVKLHARISSGDISQDALISGTYIPAAREGVESDSGRSLVNKLYRQSHDSFPHLHEGSGWAGSGIYYSAAPRYSRDHHLEHHQIKLLRSPVVNVAYISYIGTDGNTYTLNPTPFPWQANKAYVIGNQVVDSNGNLQQVTAVSEAGNIGVSVSGSTAPAWNLSGTTVDNQLTWTYQSAAPASNVLPSPQLGDFIVSMDAEPPRLTPLYGQVWPATLRVPDAVQIYFTAGYGSDAATAPAQLKVALMAIVADMYENRETLTDVNLYVIPNHIERLIALNRVRDYNPTR
jgi:hypothetical protein